MRVVSSHDATAQLPIEIVTFLVGEMRKTIAEEVSRARIAIEASQDVGRQALDQKLDRAVEELRRELQISGRVESAFNGLRPEGEGLQLDLRHDEEQERRRAWEEAFERTRGELDEIRLGAVVAKLDARNSELYAELTVAVEAQVRASLSRVESALERLQLGLEQAESTLPPVKDERAAPVASTTGVTAAGGRRTPSLEDVGDGHSRATRSMCDASDDKDGLLRLAAEKGHLEMVRCLLEAGVDRDTQEEECRTPLHIAAQNGHVHVVQFLSRVGADKDRQDAEGRTPLHVAAENGQLNVVQVLCVAGADMDR